MKIVHLNTYDGNGGAGRAALRLNNALKGRGIDSQVICLYQFNQYSGVKTAWQTIAGKMQAVFNIFSERFLIRPFLKNLDIPFSLQRFGVSVGNLQSIREADIVHLHWINHGFLASSEIRELAALDKKIVWTTHDSNPFTGGCHVRYNCDNYTKGCGNCPVLKRSSERDLSYRTFTKKLAAYKGLDLTFIAPSRWMRNATSVSLLAKNRKVSMIPNGLDMKIFKPFAKEQARQELNIGRDKFVILAGYMPSKFSRHKGFSELINVLAKFTDLDVNLLNRTEVIFFGSDQQVIPEILPVKISFAGIISDDTLLSKYYGAADCFLMTSLEESMGYTALESIACGTPVVAFDTSGVRDVVLHKQTGYMAQLSDAKAMVEGIEWVAEQSTSDILSTNCRQHALEYFEEGIIAEEHIALYQTLLNNDV